MKALQKISQFRDEPTLTYSQPLQFNLLSILKDVAQDRMEQDDRAEQSAEQDDDEGFMVKMFGDTKQATSIASVPPLTAAAAAGVVKLALEAPGYLKPQLVHTIASMCDRRFKNEMKVPGGRLPPHPHLRAHVHLQ